MSRIALFKKAVHDHYQTNRRELPWRRTRDPYTILVSEVMLQQTQVARVIPKYRAWLDRFPDIAALAEAEPEDVLRAWQGLGYNRRAKALWELARIVTERHQGRLPSSAAELKVLPGVGGYTASAVRVFAADEPLVLIETNIRRACLHHFFPRQAEVPDQELAPILAQALLGEDPREWHYALMDYGAHLGLALKDRNPNRRAAGYRTQSRFKGSVREMRGEILRRLLAGSRSVKEFAGDDRGRAALEALAKEGMIRIAKGKISIISSST